MSNVVKECSLPMLKKTLRVYDGKLVSICGSKLNRGQWDDHFKKTIIARQDDPQIRFICNTLRNLLDPAPSIFNIDRSRKNILDAGCGMGEYSEALIRQGYSVTGIDYSELAAKSIKQKNLFNVAVCDVEHLPFNNNYFDVYISCGLLTYFEDLTLLLEEAHRVVKPFGFIVLKFTYLSLFKRIAASINQFEEIVNKSDIVHYYHSIYDVEVILSGKCRCDLMFLLPTIARSVETGLVDSMVIRDNDYLFNYNDLTIGYIKIP